MPDPNPKAAYWTRQPRPAQPTAGACWTDQCPNRPAPVQSLRWAGTYCQPCQTTLLPSLVYAETN